VAVEPVRRDRIDRQRQLGQRRLAFRHQGPETHKLLYKLVWQLPLCSGSFEKKSWDRCYDFKNIFAENNCKKL
jgi:hypothetical protein